MQLAQLNATLTSFAHPQQFGYPNILVKFIRAGDLGIVARVYELVVSAWYRGIPLTQRILTV